jgi:DNA-binding NtrC family response regulator
MLGEVSGFEEVNVLASATGWPWPRALHDIFEPRGVNLMVATRAEEFVSIIGQKRIQAAIFDLDSEFGGLAAVRIIRMDYPWLPFILLKEQPDEELLLKALQLDVFSVLDKPVDIQVLRQQLNRLFIRRYNSELFADR